MLFFLHGSLKHTCSQKITATIDDDICKQYQCIQGGVVRGDESKKELAFVFAGGDYADGGEHILKTLSKHNIKSSFFFTGDFYRNPEFEELIDKLIADDHYLGAHSDKHLLYCDWSNRDSLLVNRQEFVVDLEANYNEMARFDIDSKKTRLFIPPYEWYNNSISCWAKEIGIQLFNFTPGTRTNADYTTPSMDSYRSSDEIWQSITDYEENSPEGLNGFIMLIHIGTSPERTDKFYYRLDDLIVWLRNKNYQLKRIDELILVK